MFYLYVHLCFSDDFLPQSSIKPIQKHFDNYLEIIIYYLLLALKYEV